MRMGRTGDLAGGNGVARRQQVLTRRGRRHKGCRVAVFLEGEGEGGEGVAIDVVEDEQVSGMTNPARGVRGRWGTRDSKKWIIS